MPQTEYELTPLEQEDLKRIKDRIARDGGLYACDDMGELLLDANHRPMPREFVILRGRHYLVDPAGRAWRYFAEGTRKDPTTTDGGGAPWRNNRVEMWNGRWRRVAGQDGKTTYEKVLLSRPLDKRINGQPGKAQLEWYIQERNYRHPLDAPHEIPPQDRDALDRQLAKSSGGPGRAAKPTNR
jgi:hypothetical protein